MSILAYIGDLIQEKEKVNSQTDETDINTFNRNIYRLYNTSSIYRNMKNINDNIFLSQGNRVLLLHMFRRIQKVYFAMLLFNGDAKGGWFT